MDLLLRMACGNVVLICVYQWLLAFSGPAALAILSACFLTHLSVLVVSLCRVRYADDAQRWSFVAWSLVFALLASLLLLRHVAGVDAELIALAAAAWLLAVLVVSASCACYVILQAAERWSEHLFVACTAFWWMFHDPANPWVARAGLWPLAPSLLLYAVRVAAAADKGSCHAPEVIGWGGLACIDAVWVAGRLSSPWFFALYGCAMVATLAVSTSCAHTGRLFCIPCALPFFTAYGVALACAQGPQRAYEKTAAHAEEMIRELEPDVHSLVHELGLPEI
jgi:hypothetical protein